MTVYFSGAVASVPATLHVAGELFAHRRLVGSSGGALLAAFLSLRQEHRDEKRNFLNLCGRVAGMSTWAEVYGALRGWVRDVTGGAACTMRQWCAQCAFSPVLYDFERARPVVIGPGRHAVAYVLACCVLRDAPARGLPALPEPWIDVETVLHPSLLSRALVPPVALHFTSCFDRSLRPEPGDVMGLQEQALHAPPCSLTWNVPLPHSDASLLPSALIPSRWPGLLSLRWARAAATASAEDRAVFALGFLAWALLGLILH